MLTRMMRLYRTIAWIAVALLATVGVAFAQQAVPNGARSADGLWRAASDQDRPAAQRRSDLARYAVFQLDRAALDAQLLQAPNEDAANRSSLADVIVTLPLPDGRFSRFRIEESPILAPTVAAQYPEFKTYSGAGLDDRTATARLDVTANGFHAMIIAAGGTIYVDPYSRGDLVNHVSYDKSAMQPRSVPFVDEVVGASDAVERAYNSFPIVNGTTRRTYRLAIATTGEYTAVFGGSTGAAAQITTTVNRVSGIYEREVAVRLSIVSTQVYTNAATDPYSNNDGVAMLGQNQSTLDTVVGTANYDIGHVFSTGGGGIASLSSVCNSGSKARGVTGSPNPTGDGFDVDYVAHEIGHQFGGNHTFNSSVSSCGGGNRAASHAFEVGSGSTIMAYAGICGSENTQPHSDDIFTVESLNEITAFVTSLGGSTCGTTAATGNASPVVTGPGAAFTIPANTPFELTASATDANGDTLTYLWEQFDLGPASTGSNAWIDDGSRPLFRSYTPSTSPIRMFPSLTYILNNANVPPTTSGGYLVGEVLPSTNRTMQFQLTVRDNRAGGGSVITTQTAITVTTGIPALAVTAPNSAVALSGSTTVTWTTGSQSLAPNVAIVMSTDGGVTFPYVLAASTPNDGSAAVTLPNITSSTARIKVAAVGNVFFDISNTNFSVSPGVVTPPGAFSKTTPANAATGQPRSLTVTWATSSGATSYTYCADTTNNATCDGSWVAAGTATSALLGGLLANTTYYWQVRATNTAGTTEANTNTWWSFTTRDNSAAVAGDFDGDGRADNTVYRPSTGVWYPLYSGGGAGGTAWGLSTDLPVPGDYDGDRRVDIAVFRASDGGWYIIRSATGTPQFFGWGTVGDVPVPADYDGDGVTDVAVYRPSTGAWYILKSSGGLRTLAWGVSTDIPVPADYDGDGLADVAVYRPGTGVWYVANSAGGTSATAWGISTDIPVPADYDGDGRTDIGVFRPSTGTWYLLRSTAGYVAQNWGTTGDRPVAGDYDGDGRADFAVFRPSDGRWYTIRSTGGASTTWWGADTDSPILGR